MPHSAAIRLATLLILVSVLSIGVSPAQEKGAQKGKAGAFQKPTKATPNQPSGNAGRTESGSRPTAGRRPGSDSQPDAGRQPNAGRRSDDGSQRSRGSSEQGDRGRDDSDRRPDQSSRSRPDRGSSRGPSRNDSRSRLGITIGPGGVQVYRGPSGFGPGPGFRSPYPYYFGGGPGGRYPGRRWPGYGYYGNGWGIVIQTQPQIQERVQTVIVPQATEVPEDMPVPTVAEVAAMPGADVRGLLLFAVDRFNDELSGITTGDGWRDYLQVENLRRLVPAPPEAPPAPGEELPADPPMTPPAFQELTGILGRFDQTAANAEYRQISGMWGFQSIQVTLRELLVPPIERLNRQLNLSAEFLEADLQEIETGAAWIAHLRIADLKRLATIIPQDVSLEDRRQLEDIIGTFDRVAADPGYRVISDLTGFRMTSHVMRAYRLQLSPPPSPASPPGAPENPPVPPAPRN
jgi:hypothetical protein